MGTTMSGRVASMMSAARTCTLPGLAAGMLLLAAPAASAQDAAAGAKVYTTHCVACHGADRAGMPGGAFPSLVDVGKRLDQKQVVEKITKGAGLMPPFAHLAPKDVEDVAAYLRQ